MTREEIEKAAFDSIDAPCVRDCDKCKDNYKNDCMWSIYRDGFVDGAKWRIESVWHEKYEQLYIPKRKSSMLGQLFTPEDICNLMAKIEDEPSRCINDPSCGSGRTLLAAYVNNKKAYYVGEDIDGICCKMCALNLMIHGARGRVICHDTLNSPVYFNWGYEINEVRYPIPTEFYSLRRISNIKPDREEEKEILPVKKEGYVNIVKEALSDNRVVLGHIFDSYEDAFRSAEANERYVATVKIQWEE